MKRENGAGSVYKRAGHKPWVAALPARYHADENGVTVKTQQILGRYLTRAEARAALDAYLDHPTDKINYTLQQIYDEWSPRAYQKIKKQTSDCYRAAWAKLVPLYGSKLRSLTIAQMQRIIDAYTVPRKVTGKDGKVREDKPLGESSLKNIKSVLHQLYEYAEKNDIVNKNYADFLDITAKAPVKKVGFTELEVKAMWKYVDTVPWADTVIMLCYMGWRVSEFLELTPFSYDAKQHILTGGLKTTAGKNRVVPIHRRIQPLLDRWLAKGYDTIIADADGKPLNKDSYREKCWKPALAAMGLRPLTPHAARHTCATLLSASGARPEDIQAILGHEDYALTANVYINQDTSTLAAAISRLS
ncbi:MAG: site-specific integrase [Oscillospiraceae bacterium]|nr:site-specific integrase [Oscillospiraceae bacterium]